MRKALFLFYWVKKHGVISDQATFDGLIKRTSDQITCTRVTDEVLKDLRLTREEMVAVGFRGDTMLHWVEVAITLISDITQQTINDVLPDMMAYHAKVTLTMAAHVRMTADVLARSYLSAGLLQLNPVAAQVAARAFERHLASTPRALQTSFEQAFTDDDIKLNLLGQFCDVNPPVLLWRSNGRFAALFHFLAVRHLSCPDHVLDSEGVHALWKWIEQTKRNLSFKMLNALLKLQCYLREFGNFPDSVGAYVTRIAEAEGALYRAVTARGHVARGARAKDMYASRFNMSLADIQLLKEARAAGDNQQGAASAAQSFSNYLRFLFDAEEFYGLTGLNDSLYFLVARTRAAPGRQKVNEDDAQSRSIAIVWFEKVEENVDGTILVQPVAGSLGELHVVINTVAEIATACGYYPGVAAEDTAAVVEAKYERQILSFDVVHYESVRVGDSDGPWRFLVSNAMNIEDYTFDNRVVTDLTKMAFARKLQRLDGTSDDLRAERWTLSKSILIAQCLAAVGGGAAAVHAAALPGPKAKAKGKAKVKAKAKGKG